MVFISLITEYGRPREREKERERERKVLEVGVCSPEHTHTRVCTREYRQTRTVKNYGDLLFA